MKKEMGFGMQLIEQITRRRLWKPECEGRSDKEICQALGVLRDTGLIEYDEILLLEEGIGVYNPRLTARGEVSVSTSREIGPITGYKAAPSMNPPREWLAAS